jgi:hypothetical protein
MASQPPLIAPYFCSAVIAYAEQLGLYRHVGGKTRDGPICQARAMRIKRRAIMWTVALSLSKGAYRLGVLRQAQHYGFGITSLAPCDGEGDRSRSEEWRGLYA